MISAPSEIRCNSIPQIYIISRVPRTLSASDKAIMIPLRTPMNTSSTPTTIARAIRKLVIKPLTEWATSAA